MCISHNYNQPLFYFLINKNQFKVKISYIISKENAIIMLNKKHAKLCLVYKTEGKISYVISTDNAIYVK